MSILQITAASIVLLLSIVAVLLQLASLPGTWLILAFAVSLWTFESFVPIGSEPVFGWPTLVVLASMAFIAEVLEFLAAAAGAKTGGAGKRGMTGAVVGGLLGAIFGQFVIPILVVGGIVGAIAGSALGAIVGELSVGGKQLRETMKPAAGAVAGRMAGTLAKSAFAAAMVLWLAIAMFA